MECEGLMKGGIARDESHLPEAVQSSSISKPLGLLVRRLPSLYQKAGFYPQGPLAERTSPVKSCPAATEKAARAFQ